MDQSTISVDLTPVAPTPAAPALVAAPAAPVRADWDAERERLYQQLDDKVERIVGAVIYFRKVFKRVVELLVFLPTG